MEDKLRELIEQAEITLLSYDDDRTSLNHQLEFLQKHKFEKEFEWVALRRTAMEGVFYSYRETVKEIKELLNNWES